MNVKTLPARVKAAENDDSGEGIVEALVATYDVDSIGDRIVPGAFAKTLNDWRESGQLIPFIWSHMHDDLDAYLGDVIEASETDDGLLVKAQLDLEDPKTAKAYRLIKGGRVRNYSFAYEVLDSADGENGQRLLREIKLFEVGPTLIGMNQNTRTLVVKGERVATKVGRVLSATNETSLRDAHEAIGRVLAQLDALDDEPVDDESSATQEEASSQPEEPAKRDEPEEAKRDEPTPAGPVLDDLLLEIEIATREGYGHAADS